MGVHDLPVTQRCPVRSAAETNGTRLHLLQLYGTDNSQTVILIECHGNCYRPGELARMSKDCF